MPSAKFLQTSALETLPSLLVACLIYPKRSSSKYLGSRNRKKLIRLDGASLGEGIPNQLVKSVEWVGWPDEVDEDDEDI